MGSMKFRSQITLFALLTTLSLHAYGEWVPQLESSSSSDWSHPTDSYRINIKPSVASVWRQNFSLEVDGIDVTEMVELTENFATFKPPQPLAPGLHDFRLVEYSPDGNIMELGYWEMEIRSSALYQQANTNVQGSVSIYSNVADNLPDQDKPNIADADGSLLLSSVVSDKAWALAANAAFLLNSQTFKPASNRKVELGEYVIQGQAGRFQANLGSQTVGQNSLLMQNFRRRGLSASADFSSLNSRLSGFALGSQQATTFDNITGISDSNNRIQGLLLEVQPFTDNPQRLYLSTGYLSGKGSTSGIATGDLAPANDNNTANIVADSYLFTNQLRARAEFASSKSDFDGAGPLAEINDNARHLLVSYAPAQWTTESSMFLIGLEDKKVGTFFKSLANPGLPADKKLTRAYANTLWDRVSLNVSLANEEDNVSKLETIPTVKSNVTDIVVSYIPDWDISFLGNSSYSLAFNRTRKREKNRSALVTANPTDNEVASITLTANFAYTDWGWLLVYGSGNNEDFSNINIDTEQDFVELAVNFPVGSRLYFSPGARQEVIKDTDNAIKLTNVQLNLGINAIVLVDTLTATLNTSLNQTDASDDSSNRNEAVVSAQATWNVAPLRGSIPAIDAFLMANYSKIDDKVNPQLNTTFYQAFLGLTLSY